MNFTFKRQHEGVEEEYTLTDISEELLQELLQKILDGNPTGLDTDYLQFMLYSLSMDELAAAYAAADIPENPYETALPMLEAHRPLPKSKNTEIYGEFIDIKRAMDDTPSFFHKARTRQFRRQDGEAGALNYAVQIYCPVCGREAEGWSQDESRFVKCPSCKTKLHVDRMYPRLFAANDKGQAFKAMRPVDFAIGTEML